MPARSQLGCGLLFYEATGKLLQVCGIPLTPAIMTQSSSEAAAAAEKLGYPCVINRIRRCPAQD
jgi:acyl-CoA synthetase (NDP forming)